jgi:peroxiredoxin
MKRNVLVLFLLLTALLAGCAQMDPLPTEPQLPATGDEPTVTAPVEATVPTEVTPPITVPTATQPTETTAETATVPTTSGSTIITLPPNTTPALTPPSGNAVSCSHNYQPGIYQAPTCEQAGFQTLRCAKCGDVQQQVSAPLGHSYTSATCTVPKSCVLCSKTEGDPLGHSYSGGLCSRCGAMNQRTITIQVKDSKNNPVDGVTVELHIDGQLHSTAVSSNGKVSYTLLGHTGSYTLVLTQIPQGYKTQRDAYTYRSDTGAIVLDIVPVVRPDDHSKAAYKVGSTMGDFTLTDVDGKTYQLSQLLQTKKLVILNFWYYTCVPCKAEFPYFNSVYQKYSNDIEILGLNHFDSESNIRQLRSEMGLTFPLATEHLGMQQGFGIQSYPVTVFIDSNGRILKIQKDIGFQSEAELETIVRQMLGI